MDSKLALIGGVCLGAGLITLLSHDDVSDDVLLARIRSRVKSVVSSPESVRVASRDGRITLSGSLPAGEAARLLSTVSCVRGVRGVESQLDLRCTHQESLPDPEELARLAVG
ncbi:MAG: BON domain-containing protein [Acidobacteria bacterium]|nr:BON domain-containing protein [Acidobacteriota bacterium]